MTDISNILKDFISTVKAQSNFLSGSTTGGNAGTNITVKLNGGGSISAFALNRIDSGNCIAIKADNGQYYVLPSKADHQNRENVKVFRKQQKVNPSNKNIEYEPKVGYVYQKTVGGSTALACASPAPPPVSPDGAPPNNPGIQLYSYRINISELSGTSTNLNGGDSSPILFRNEEAVLLFTPFEGVDISSYTLTTNIDEGGGASRTVSSTRLVFRAYFPGYIVITSGGSFSTTFYEVEIARSEIPTPNVNGFYRSFQNIGVYSGYTLVPLGTPAPPAPTPSPTNPADPATTSNEFWYKGDKTTTPIKLKTLATNQPLEAKPYILHISNRLSYVIMKYGNAKNDNGSENDWCKVSLFKITGSSTLQKVETVYTWQQEVALKAILKKLTFFSNLIGSKTKLENLNLNTIITDNKLKCFTQRSLSNIIKLENKLIVYLVDPVTPAASSLTDLIGEEIYNDLNTLISTAEISVTLRYFEIKNNPAYTGSAPNCATNPQYSLVEKPNKKIKNFKIKGLNTPLSDDLDLLTINVGLVQSN